MRIKKIWTKSLLLTCSLLLVACGKGEQSKPETDSKKEELADKQEITVVIPQEIAAIDTALATDKVSHDLINQIFEGLYQLDKNQQPIPAGAAEMAEVSSDGLTYTFKLREDAKWTNGDPVVASDYVYAWQRIVSPETTSEYAYLFECVKNAAEITAGKKDVKELGIEAINDYELKVTLETPTPYFNTLLTFSPFFPVNQKAIKTFGKDYAKNSKNMYYNGAFTLEDFDGVGSDIEWKFKKNPDYWDAKNVKIETVNATVVKESSTSLNMFETGQVDDIILTGELAQQSAKSEAYISQLLGRTIYLEFNKAKKETHFDNVNLRKALYYAVDGPGIVKNVLGDGSIASTGIIPAKLASNPETKKDFTEDSGNHMEFNVKKAKEYYKKAQKELNGAKISFDILTDDNESTKKIAEFLQGAYKEHLGIETTISVVTKPIRLDRSTKGDFDMVLSGWGADYNDPSSFMEIFVTGNSYNKGKYSSKKYDQLIKEAATTNATLPEKRWENYIEAEKVLLDDDAAIIPVYQLAEAHLRNPKMKGYIPFSVGLVQYKTVYLIK